MAIDWKKFDELTADGCSLFTGMNPAYRAAVRRAVELEPGVGSMVEFLLKQRDIRLQFQILIDLSQATVAVLRGKDRCWWFVDLPGRSIYASGTEEEARALGLCPIDMVPDGEMAMVLRSPVNMPDLEITTLADAGKEVQAPNN